VSSRGKAGEEEEEEKEGGESAQDTESVSLCPGSAESSTEKGVRRRGQEESRRRGWELALGLLRERGGLPCCC